MTDAFVQREGQADRLSPGRAHSRYVVLRQLAEALDNVVNVALPDGAGTVVDLGCGSQPYRSLVEARCERYLGADLPGNPLADLDVDGSGRVPLEDGAVDCVMSTQVLEHVPEPDAYLREAHRMLKVGGHLLLTTHGAWKYHPDPDDYWRWTCSGMRKIVEDAGFEVVTARSVLGLAGSSMQLFQDSWSKRIPRGARRVFLWTMQRLIARSSPRVRDGLCPDASVYVVLAEKR